jgi:hypothetical protein
MHRATAATALVIVALCLQACGAGTRRVAGHSPGRENASASRFDFGTFAGYARLGDARQAAATITVPRIAASSPAGVASAWVGVKREGRYPAPFVQAGVVAWGPGAPAAAGSRYEAFWSDTNASFRPRWLFRVAPGDRLRAKLSRTAAGWLISVRNLTSGVGRSILDTERPGSLRAQVEWLQEDPGGAHPAAYPAIQGATFSSLSVDGTTPRQSELLVNWMSPRGTSGYLAPSPVHEGSFQIAPRALSAPAIEWIRLTQALQARQAHLWRLVKFTWNRSTSLSTIDEETRRLASEERRVAARVAAIDWPSRAQPAIADAYALMPHVLAVTGEAPGPSTSAYRRWRREYLDLGEVAFPYIRRLDEVLGIPYSF